MEDEYPEYLKNSKNKSQKKKEKTNDPLKMI